MSDNKPMIIAGDKGLEFIQTSYDENRVQEASVSCIGRTPELLLECLNSLVKYLEDEYVANPNG
jgi:hypothetical protein